MRFSLIFLSLFFFLVSLSTWAKGKITALDYKTSGNVGVVNVKVEGDWDGVPALTIKDNIVQVSLSDAFVWPKIEKKVAAETTLTAYQFDKENVRVRAILNDGLTEAEVKKVSVVMGENGFELRYPVKAVNTAKATPTSQVVKNKNAADYDESYLEKLIEDTKSNQKEEVKAAPSKVVAASLFDEESAPASPNLKTDTVTSLQAAPEKESGFKLDIVSYIGKFVAFLGIILAFFYGAVVTLRKGVFKKGKLNFLNSPKTIEVLNTTYIAPKRSMMIVRVGKQVFLVGSSENGLHMMGEIDAPAELMKNEEESVRGTNFDLNLKTEDASEKEFNLKQDITKPAKINAEEGLGSFLANAPKDKVRLSDQIKTKVKSLKSLQ